MQEIRRKLSSGGKASWGALRRFMWAFQWRLSRKIPDNSLKAWAKIISKRLLKRCCKIWTKRISGFSMGFLRFSMGFLGFSMGFLGFSTYFYHWLVEIFFQLRSLVHFLGFFPKSLGKMLRPRSPARITNDSYKRRTLKLVPCSSRRAPEGFRGGWEAWDVDFSKKMRAISQSSSRLEARQGGILHHSPPKRPFFSRNGSQLGLQGVVFWSSGFSPLARFLGSGAGYTSPPGQWSTTSSAGAGSRPEGAATHQAGCVAAWGFWGGFFERFSTTATIEEETGAWICLVLLVAPLV